MSTILVWSRARAKARESVWWPKCSKDIQRHVASCDTCNHHARDCAEPLLPTSLPDLPWQKVGTDLFELANKHSIVVVDYYSRYIELMKLKRQTADDVISALKSIFARHSIPMIVQSDNRPCYSAVQFSIFSSSYCFSHQTSSPRFAQANGAAERAVQTMKAMLKKSQDPFLALLSYRSTSVINGYSPAQLLMGRQLRSTVPNTITSLQPHTPDVSVLQQRDHNIKERQAADYNKRHRAREGRKWQVKDQVWIPDLQSAAVITNVLPFRSYQLRTAAGYTVRRNGRSLRHPLPDHRLINDDDVTHAPARGATSAPALQCRMREAQPTAPAPSPPPAHRPYVTRSGRQIRRPSRLDV